MSWREDFDGAVLPAGFSSSVSGDGAVAVSGGSANITMGAAVANAGLISIDAALNTAGEFAYTIRQKIDGTISGNSYLLHVFDGIPAVGTAAVVNPNIKITVGYSASGLFIAYKDSAGTWQYWTGTTWSTSPTYFALNPAYWVDVSFLVRNSKFRISVRAFGDTKSIAESAWVTFAALQSYTALRLHWGDPFTDYYYITSMKTECVIFSDETKIWGFYNGRTGSANTYKVGRAVSFDGGEKYFRDPTTPIIDVIANESNIKDPFCTKVGATYYLFVAALMSGGDYSGKWRIRYSTSSDLETWTNQGYITTPGAADSFDENGHRFPVATYSGGIWRLYIACQDGSDLLTVGYFYDADLASLVNYASNPVIDVGAAGAWNDAGLTPVGITASGATISLHVLGLKAATAKWQGGLWTSTDWVTWTPDGSNPIIARNAAKQTAASNVTAGNVTITVGDSTIFENDDPIILSDGSNSHSNRVLSKGDSTHITMYYPSPTNLTTPTVSGFNWGSVGIEGLDLDNQADRALGVTFQAGAVLLETSAWWEYSAGWAYKPLKTPPLSLGCVWDTVSAENLKWIHNGITLVLTKSLSDSFTLTDSVSNGVGLNKAETITLSDAIAKGIGKFPSDTVTLSDLFSKIWTASLSLSDGFTLSEAIGKTPGLTKSDAIILSDLFSKAWTANLSLSDVISLIDAISKTPILAKSDVLTLTDFLSYLKTIGLNLSDNISLSDAITKILSHFEDFSYKTLKQEVLPLGQEGGLFYEKTKSEKPSPGIEGDFKYKKVN